ncbi:capsular polysaccharide export protein, LipB/KpsS family [Halovulum sp. GXIMD14794]
MNKMNTRVGATEQRRWTPEAYARFLEYLEQRQNAPFENVSPRARVLGLLDQEIGIGYIGGNLAEGFPRNLGMVFPRLVPFNDTSRFEQTRTRLITGSVFSSEKHSHPGAVAHFADPTSPEREAFFIEMAFVAATESWSHGFHDANGTNACLGYVYDDMSFYFMKDYPNRLIRYLNRFQDLDALQALRARGVIDRIVSERISKYNAQPLRVPVMGEGYSRRVLVCDQTFADASVLYGGLDERRFEDMLLSAVTENPDAEILVKVHPDTAWEPDKRKGYFTHLENSDRVRILREPLNPHSLFELVDTVYVGSSQMGFEALLAGKKVVCFGAPFYAGWGLTDDRMPVPHRERSRTLEEVFHAFYIWYSIYHRPDMPAPCEIEDVIDFVVENRPVSLPLQICTEETAPKVSVVLPVFGVERVLEVCLASIQKQTLRDIEIITVNDCSPDNSQEIIDRFAAEDPRFRPIVLDKNVGQGFARNHGIDAARGEFVWFLDSDDYFASPDHLETVYRIAVENQSDMVRGKKMFERVEDAQGRLVRRRADDTERHFVDSVGDTSFSDAPNLLHNRHFWTWLYRREFLNRHEIRFINTQWEERPFLLKALLKAEHIAISQSEAMVYRVRPNSTARRTKGQRDFDLQIRNFQEVANLLEESNAFERNSPLRKHMEFIFSQYTHYQFFGFCYKSVMSGAVNVGLNEYISLIRDIFVRADFLPDDFNFGPEQLSRDHVRAGAYPLLVAAIRAGKAEMIDAALELRPVSQKKLYSEYLSSPENDGQAEWQRALNQYALNERVGLVQSSGLKPTGRPRVILHIGSTKTGSTYLQNLMERNRPDLLRRGIWFPEIGLFWQPDRPHKRAGHSKFTRAAAGRDKELRDKFEAGLSMLGDSIHTVVLSSEAFFLNRRSSLIAGWLSEYDLEVVVYLRQQDVWANSQYCEFVAGGAVNRVDVEPEEWLMRRETQSLLDYAGLLEHWADAVGRDRIVVRPYERSALVNGDIVADFAEAAKLPELRDLPPLSLRERNEASLSAGAVKILRRFNTLPYQDADAYFRFVEEATQGLVNLDKQRGRVQRGAPDMFGPKLRTRIRESVAEGNRRIAETYLGREDGVLFREPPAELIVDEEPVEELGFQTVLDAYSRNAPRLDQNDGEKQRVPSVEYADRSSARFANGSGLDILENLYLRPRARRSGNGFIRVSPGKARRVLAGPYFVLDPGQYSLEMIFSADHGPISGLLRKTPYWLRLRVICDGGNTTLGEVDSELSVRGGTKVVLGFELPSSAGRKDVEVVVSAYQKATFSILGARIRPN